MAGRKLTLLLAVGLVLVVANAKIIMAMLEKYNVIASASHIVATCLTGSTLVVLLALVWLLPNRQEE